MRITSSMAETRELYADAPVGLVPTMGFLHEGHVALLEAARAECGTVAMTVFVNPLQFNEAVDLERYPRDLERDVELAREAGVDMVFAPSTEEMYPLPVATTVSVAPLTERMEGAHRPGHFEGVATVVTKLLAGLRPDRAYFGKKDAQQLATIRRLVVDLSIPTTVVAHPTVRESDGLALSSRNVFLSATDRKAALALSRGLMVAADAAEAGERSGRGLEEIVLDTLAAAGGVEAEYAELASARDVARLDSVTEDCFLAVAASVGDVRLIDNVHLDVNPDGVLADRGILLDRPSVLYSQAENL
ncbi:MAG: pantoate--beta-alanine ligase [Acidimicrobiia bacterium]|nr:pantoate--beta-alanine ligase [Acidimicrobiia bacterium]